MYSTKKQLISSYKSGLKNAQSHLKRIIYLENRLTLSPAQKARISLVKAMREAEVKQWELLIDWEDST
jgi:hypothetical protein